MDFDNKTLVMGALVVGAIVVVLVMKGSGGSGVSTIAPLPSGDAGDRTQAFSSLLDLGRTELEVRRDLSLGFIQAGVENNRISAAERASIAESQSQLRMAEMQASAQTSGSIFDFLGQIASIALPVVL